MDSSPRHPWIARLSTALAMLALAFIGLIFTQIGAAGGGWNYWRWTAVLYALLALWLSWYLRRKKESLSPVTLWHEALHWVGLIGAVFLVSFFLKQGLLSRLSSSLVTTTLFALAVFIAGVYIELSFLFIGILLALFAAVIAFLQEYLYALAVPLILLIIAIVVILLWRKRHHPPPPEEGHLER